MNAPMAWAIWAEDLYRKEADKTEFQVLINEFQSHYPGDDEKFKTLMRVLKKYATDYGRYDLFT